MVNDEEFFKTVEEHISDLKSGEDMVELFDQLPNTINPNVTESSVNMQDLVGKIFEEMRKFGNPNAEQSKDL